MRKKLVVTLLLAIAAFAVLPLAAGTDWLGDELPGGLPLGNAMAAVGLCAVAGAALGLSRPGTALRIVSLCMLAATAVWLPTSIALAGNAALNFADGGGSVWWVFSLAVAMGAIASLAWAGIAALFALRVRK